jgi:hypothetical protein
LNKLTLFANSLYDGKILPAAVVEIYGKGYPATTLAISFPKSSMLNKYGFINKNVALICNSL